ncbi:prenyltransferase [Melissospora conviva]|uniref:prenyltransferase n=1 Tax=Melissospora conviva TaxID=3388432 RepID=UPI003C14FF89
MSVPELPGVLTADDIVATARSIAAVQEPSGAIPWVPGGEVDPWDHVESAMALDVAGLHAEAVAAYEWLRRVQRPDGTWASRYRHGEIIQPISETNHAAYLAVGVWHHWLSTSDTDFLARFWPAVSAGLDFAVGCQAPSGVIWWAVDAAGNTDPQALLTGSSSIHQALRCGVAIGALLGEERPEWELAADRLAHAIRHHPGEFADKSRFSMDWYYPVLGGALTGDQARERLRGRWDEFVTPDMGARCVADRPWITGAETCELALALDVAGRPDAAAEMVAAMQHLREVDGSYWTGVVLPEQVRWPDERSTWTGAAVVLAVDALHAAHPRSGIFRDSCREPDAGAAACPPELVCAAGR